MWNIIAVVLVAGVTAFALMQVFGVFSSASNQMSQQSMLSSVASSIAVIKNAYSSNPNYNGFNDTVAKNIGAVPTGWTGDGPFKIPSGGTVSFASATVNGQADAGYRITFTGVTPNTCAAIAGLNIPQLVSIKIGTAADIKNPAYDSTATNWPPTPALIAQQCAALPTSGSVVLTLI